MTPYRQNLYIAPRPKRDRAWLRFARAIHRVSVWVIAIGLVGVEAYAGYAPTPSFVESPIAQTKNNLRALHAVTEAWRANHDNACPTLQRLKDERELQASSDINDGWGSPYAIECDADNTTIISFGPDKKKSTLDDLRFPEPQP